MNRRKAVATLTLWTGGALLATSSLLQACRMPVNKRVSLTDADIPLLDEIGETIIPATAASPGAKEARVGAYMKLMVDECYAPTQQKTFIDGLNEFEADCDRKYGTSFIELGAKQRREFIKVLNERSRDQRSDDNHTITTGSHYFTLIKNLAVNGFLTSKAGALTELQYQLVPGKYEGCVAYKKEGPVW